MKYRVNVSANSTTRCPGVGGGSGGVGPPGGPVSTPLAAAAECAAVRTLAEVLAGTDLAGWLPPGVLAGRTAVGQLHCHHRSVLGTAADAALLDHLGLQSGLCDGCCGLAGNFGFERGHYAISQAVAAGRLYPSLRAAAPDAVLLADGFSCRTQIAQGTGRRARHLAELLADTLPDPDAPP